jgi:hypothetical protein
MARLPIPGSDDGTWGDVLNAFLAVEHNPDGSLKPTGSLSLKADDASVVHLSGGETIAGSKTFSSAPIVPTPTQNGHAATKSYVDSGLAAAVFPNFWQPVDNGLLAAPFDPAACAANGSQPLSGALYLVAVPLRAAATISNVHAMIGAAGSGLTNGRCFFGLYNSTGSLLASTADQSANWATTGNIKSTFTTPYAAAAGTYYIAVLVNGTTAPAFACGTTFGVNFTPGNINRTAVTARFARGPSGQTSLPASVTMSSLTLDATSYWFGVS